jgi:hypothetical protein
MVFFPFRFIIAADARIADTSTPAQVLWSGCGSDVRLGCLQDFCDIAPGLIELAATLGVDLKSHRRDRNLIGSFLAERGGFEPPIALRLCLISSQVHSTGLCHLSALVGLFLIYR